jgi:hypothetical protein
MFTGVNILHLNPASMREAVQEYLNARLTEPIEVTHIAQPGNEHFNVTIKAKDQS